MPTLSKRRNGNCTNWGSTCSSSRVIPAAAASPANAPTSDNSNDSVRSCRTTRVRPAPNARRNANSFSRAAPRASIRFDTLTQAISSTNPTNANTAVKTGCTSFTPSSAMGVTATVSPPLVSGKVPAKRRPMRSISRRACSSVTPAFSRAHTPKEFEPRSRSASSNPAGTQSSLRPEKNSNPNPAGMTPTTV